MRIFERIIFALILGATPVAGPGFAFDGAPTAPDAAIPVVSSQPGAAAALKKAITPSPSETSLTSLQYEVRRRHHVEKWKLRQQSAEDDGENQDHHRALE